MAAKFVLLTIFSILALITVEICLGQGHRNRLSSGRTRPRDSDSDVEEEPGSAAGGGRGGIAGKRSCLYIRGLLKCGFKHDEKTVVVRFVDSIRGVQDEGYSSQYGYFQVTGCTAASSKPELHILHTCKDHQARRLKIFVPDNIVGGEYNITDSIDLKAHFINEEAYNDKIEVPCDPF